VSRKFSHKIWGAAPLIPLKVFGNIRSLKKSTHLLACSVAKKANLTGIQTSLSGTPYFSNAL